MPSIVAWCTAIALSLILGLVIGNGVGGESKKSLIANECRKSGAFTVKRTGFYCGVIK